jgi:putative FmdB family regulatory protein
VSAPGAAYLALACREPDRVAAVLRDVLSLPRLDSLLLGERPVPVFALGTTPVALFEPDDPFLDGASRPGIRHLALANDAPESAARALGLAGEAVDGEFRVATAATGGLGLRFAPPSSDVPPASAGPIERIDHVGVASSDNAAAQALFVTRLGCPLESTQTDLEVSMAVESFTSDRYGVVYHSRAPVPIGGLRVSFVTVGDFELEFLQPFDPTPGVADGGEALGTSPGNTRGDRGAIGRYLERNGPGLHHLALKTADIERTLARFGAAGLRVIDRVGRPGSRRALIGFVHPEALGGLLVHFVSGLTRRTGCQPGTRANERRAGRRRIRGSAPRPGMRGATARRRCAGSSAPGSKATFAAALEVAGGGPYVGAVISAPVEHMPIYEYECNGCGERHEFIQKFSDGPKRKYECNGCGERHEFIQKFSDGPKRKCPSCGRSRLRKLVSAAAFHLKGEGWYVTDFRDKDKKKKKEDAPDAKADAKADAKSDSKTDAKSGGDASRSAGKPEAKASSSNGKSKTTDKGASTSS